MLRGRIATRHNEIEGRTSPRLALYRAIAVHDFSEARDERQAQAGAPIVAGRAAFALAKAVEEVADLFGRDTDARVLHRELNGGPIALQARRDAQRHHSLACELE